jgi:hypothetical protein
MHKIFSIAGNLFTTTITNISSLSIFWGYDCIVLYYSKVPVQAKFKTPYPGLENAGCHNARDAQLTPSW